MGLLHQVAKTCYKALVFHIDTHLLLRQNIQKDDIFVRYNIHIVGYRIFM